MRIRDSTHREIMLDWANEPSSFLPSAFRHMRMFGVANDSHCCVFGRGRGDGGREEGGGLLRLHKRGRSHGGESHVLRVNAVQWWPTYSPGAGHLERTGLSSL